MKPEYPIIFKAFPLPALLHAPCFTIADVNSACLKSTGKKETNENLQKKANQLDGSNEELEKFAYLASHDLQEPLRTVTGFLTQLEKKYGDVIDEKGKKYIGLAVDGAKRMRQILPDVPEDSRPGRTEDSRENVDLNGLVKEIQILFRRQVEEKSAFTPVDKLPILPSYKALLGEVFQNIISKALKYARKGASSQIHVTARKLKNCRQFSVTDNGMGINEEYFDKIFVIFQRLHDRNEFSGTRMGNCRAREEKFG